MQELKTMNIQMRIITEKNINHLESMKKSDNVFKLIKDTLDNVLKTSNKIISNTMGKLKPQNISKPLWIDDENDWEAPKPYENMGLDDEESIKPLFEGNIPLKQGELPASGLTKEQLDDEINNGRIVLNLWEPIFLNHFVRWVKATKEDIILEKFPLINAYDNLSEQDKQNTYWNNKNTFLDDIKNKWQKSSIKVSKEEFKAYIEKVYKISQQFDRGQ